jgi:hypothetical protein
MYAGHSTLGTGYISWAYPTVLPKSSRQLHSNITTCYEPRIARATPLPVATLAASLIALAGESSYVVRGGTITIGIGRHYESLYSWLLEAQAEATPARIVGRTLLHHKVGACARYKRGDDIKEYCFRNGTLRFRGLVRPEAVTNQHPWFLVRSFFSFGIKYMFKLL